MKPLKGSHCGCCGCWIEREESESGWSLCDRCVNLGKEENKKKEKNMLERYNFLEIKLLISEEKKKSAPFEELQKAQKDTSDFRHKVLRLLQDFNLKQNLCHLNLYGAKKDPCPTNIEEGDIVDLSTNFLN